MSTHKFRVYLAGPISGCSEVQIHKWRDEVKQKYEKNLDFIDPSEMRRASSYEIVKNDIDSIEAADGMLVNMWRESIGSAIGIVHAHRAGKPVVIANPNHLNNLILKFYAAAMEETPQKAANVLLHILRADANWRVIKSSQREDEPFSREKLTNSIRAVSRDAKRDNIVVPALVLPKVIEHFRKSDRKQQKQLTTGAINKAVMESLAELEADPGYASAVKGVSAKWRLPHKAKRSQLSSSKAKHPTPSSSQAADVNIASGKSHGTIWGTAVKNLAGIPSSNARHAFQTIMQVHGITRIKFGAFNRREERASFGVVVSASKQPTIIEGKMFDKGKKGTMQTFQVRVQHASGRGNTLAGIISKLKEGDYWAG